MKKMIDATKSDDSSDFVFFATRSLTVHTAMTMAKASTEFMRFGSGWRPHPAGERWGRHPPQRVAQEGAPAVAVAGRTPAAPGYPSAGEAPQRQGVQTSGTRVSGAPRRGWT
ncbi:hypothetical protein GCM10022275_08490 [Tessaracoccus defluvii]